MVTAIECPFCGSKNTGVSTSSGKDCYYKQIYCKKCHAYGPRIRIAVDQSKCVYNKRYEVEHDEQLNDKAINLWNSRIYFSNTCL